MKDFLRPKLLAKHVLRRLIYRFPPVMLAPERLYLWLDTLRATEAVEGSVLEVGCYLGGTAAISKKFLDNTGVSRRYICIDTFGGFIREQWTKDEKLGSPGRLSRFFSSNSPALARWVLDRHGGANVEIIQADIIKIPPEMLPDQISACLVDVDLSEPVFGALELLYPHLQPNGVILVDDCGDERSWKARIGYERFTHAAGLPEEFQFGMGIIRKQSPGTCA